MLSLWRGEYVTGLLTLPVPINICVRQQLRLQMWVGYQGELSEERLSLGVTYNHVYKPTSIVWSD